MDGENNAKTLLKSMMGVPLFLQTPIPRINVWYIYIWYTRWWALKDVLCSSRSLGKIAILTNMFQMG